MKKLCMFMAVVLLFSFALTSCGLFKPSTTEALREKVVEKMDKLSSYRIETEMDMIFYSGRNPITANYEMETIVINNKNPYYYNSAVTKVECAALKLNEESTSIIAYNDGNMFSSSSGNNLNQRLYSSLEYDSFLEFISNRSLMLSDIIGCDEIDSDENEDGGWVIECSEYSKKEINTLIEKVGIDDAGYASNVVGVNTTIECDKKCRVEKIKISFIFEELDENIVPSVEIEMNYSDYNDADTITNTIAPADYKEVDDVLIIYEIMDMIDSKKNSEKGAFTLDITQRVSVGSSTVSSNKQRNSVNYGEEDGKYYYSIDGSKYTSTQQTEYAARAIVNALIDSAGYDPMIVTGIEKAGDNTYKLKCSVQISDYADVIKPFGATYRDSSSEITVTLDNNGIRKIANDVLIELRSSGKDMGISIQTTIMFSS